MIRSRYDGGGLLTGAVTLSRHAQNGLLTGSTLGAVADILTHSSFGEVATYEADVSGIPQYAVEYTRDALGRIVQKTETIEGALDTYEYGYDLAGRLIDVSRNGVPIAHYDYDTTATASAASASSARRSTARPMTTRTAS